MYGGYLALRNYKQFALHRPLIIFFGAYSKLLLILTGKKKACKRKGLYRKLKE
jgi:hypothetical protein